MPIKIKDFKKFKTGSYAYNLEGEITSKKDVAKFRRKLREKNVRQYL